MEVSTLHSDSFRDFQLIDTGSYRRLERWGGVVLSRPDPQAIWLPKKNSDWQTAHAEFNASADKGSWKIKRDFARPWVVLYQGVKLLADLTPFKHTGLFAEQAANWDWMLSLLGRAERKEATVLNLFAYTGAASVILAKAGCRVTHVDASKPSVNWAAKNKELNGLPDDRIRWIVDDAAKFVKRELKRGKRYDGILMDPPAFGHGPSGQVWKFNEHFPGLLRDCCALLSGDPFFLLANAYATNISSLALKHSMADFLSGRGKIESGELCLRDEAGRMVSTGVFARWQPLLR